MGRIKEFDEIKGLMIFIVVWYHCIQYIGGSVFENPVFDRINAFNMPVFMIVSGLFLRKSLTKSHFIVNNAISLLIPNVFWGTLSLIICFGFDIKEMNWGGVISIPFSCWFLSSLFVCRCVYWLMSKTAAKTLVSTVIASSVILFVPGNEYTKYMMPFIGIGMIIDQSHILANDIFKNRKLLFLLLILGGISLLYWSNDFSIYGTKNPSWLSLIGMKEYAIRILYGVLFFFVFYALFKSLKLSETVENMLIKLGNNSLGIYVIHFTLLKNISSVFNIDNWVVESLVCFVIAIIITIAVNQIIYFIKKNRLTSLFMLGVKL